MSAATKQDVLDELSAVRATFRQLVSAMTAEDLKRRTTGTRWTNREMLFHMLFGYLLLRALIPLVKAFDLLPGPASKVFAAVLNAGTRPFHPINYLASLAGGRVLTPPFMLRQFDRLCQQLARRLAEESDANLAKAMHFPTGWDPFFKPRMTLLDVYHYPTQHFEFHRRQLAFDKHREPFR